MSLLANVRPIRCPRGRVVRCARAAGTPLAARANAPMSHLLQILLLLALIVAAAKLAGAAASRFGQPAVFGELLVGLLLGPTVLNVLSWGIFAGAAAGTEAAAPVPILGLLNDLADVGVILLMLVAGLE